MRLPNGSGMNREVHVPFCERLQGKFQWSTQQRSDSEVQIFSVCNHRDSGSVNINNHVSLQILNKYFYEAQ